MLTLEVIPSPKFQEDEIAPTEALVNAKELLFIHWLILLVVNTAVGLLANVKLRSVLSLQPKAFVATNLIIYEPVVAYNFVGLVLVEVVASPKFQKYVLPRPAVLLLNTTFNVEEQDVFPLTANVGLGLSITVIV